MVSPRNPVRRTRERLEVMRGLPTVYTYREALGALWPVPTGAQLSYPIVIHAWDNSPRSGMNGLVLRDSDPELFRLVLRRAIELRSEGPASERIVFLKSWNEWAEGNHLEPDLRYGRAFLQVVREEVSWVDQRLERVGVAPALRRGVQLSAPPMTISHLQMEPTTRCNFTCGFCWGRHLPQEDIAFETAEKALQRADKAAKAQDKDAIKAREVIRRVREALDAGTPVRALSFDDTERPSQPSTQSL